MPHPRWFHVGGDEAHAMGRCTDSNIAGLEGFLVKDVVNSLGLTPVAWEELRLKKPEELGVVAVGGSTETIVMPWRLGTVRRVIRRGHRAIAANLENHYLDSSYVQNSVNVFWYDIAAPRPGVRDEPDAPSCQQPAWDFVALRYLGGRVGTQSTVGFAEAEKHCIAAGEACAGITCQRGVEASLATNVEIRSASSFGISAKGAAGAGAQLGCGRAGDRDVFVKIPHPEEARVYKFESTTHPGLFIGATLGARSSEQKAVLCSGDGVREYFLEVAPLSGAPPPAVSLESVAAPQHFLAHFEGALWCHEPQAASHGRRDLFDKDATWTTVGEAPASVPEAGCEARRGLPYLLASETEDSWTRRCPEDDKIIKDGLLGGMSAMWTDRYCYIFQCGAADASIGEKAGKSPNAGLMFLRSLDASFAVSLAGMIWPRAAVSAATLWRFDASLRPPEVRNMAAWLAALLRSRGVSSCPSGCTCDELSACGKPYPVLWSRPPPSTAAVPGDSCFSEGPEGRLGPALGQTDRGVSRAVEDARAMCFWLGPRCRGLKCGADTLNRTLCRLHRARKTTEDPQEFEDSDTFGSAGPKASLIFLKDLGKLCAPYAHDWGFVAASRGS